MSGIEGIVAVLADSEGHVVAHSADFSKSVPGGFTVEESQKRRARDRLGHRMLEVMCSRDIAAAVDTMDAADYLSALCAKCGYSVSFLKIDESAGSGTIPCIITLLTAPAGHVVAHAASFGPAEERSHALHAELAINLLRASCSSDFLKATRACDAIQIMESLCHKKGYRVTEIEISTDRKETQE